MAERPSDLPPPCVICGAKTVSLFSKAHHQFFKCRACGFVVGRSPSNANLAQAFVDYEAAYRQYLAATPADAANHAALLQWIEGFVRLDDPAISVLDVGAGSGKFLRYIRANRRCVTAGIEPSEALFSAFDLGQLGVFNSTLPLFARAVPDQCDVVTAIDVSEHVEDPVEFAMCLYRITKPGGFVFLSTPDTGSLTARLMGRHWHHYNRYHLSLFNMSTLGRLAEAAGFVVAASGHHGKQVPLSYLRNYVRDFLLRTRTQPRTPGRDRSTTVPVNLFDIVSIVWQRPR
jgi:SAM-dependent methyltransferase